MPSPIRILHVIGAMNRAGAETMIMNLYRACDTDKVQFDFLVNDEGDYDEEIRSRGGRMYRIPRYAIRNYRSYRKACAAFFDAHDEFAVVHGHIGLPAPIYLEQARRRGIYAVAHSHAQNYPLSPSEAAFRLCSFPVRRHADFFMACSRQAGIDRFGMRVCNDTNRFFVLNNGIDLARYRFDAQKRRDMRDELGLSEETPVFGHVGRFDPVKNHRFLLDVFAAVAEREPRAKLVLVGRPDEDGAVMAHARALGIEKSVMALGLRDDIERLLCAFDAFLFTSFKEGLGMAVVEAQAAGLPCLVSTGVPKLTRASGLVDFLDLEQGAQVWADKALDMLDRHRGFERTDAIKNVRAAGFDIAASAAWLQEFYLDHAKGSPS